MKINSILGLILISNLCIAQCPIQGNAKNNKEATANKLKNRDIILKTNDTIKIEDILKDGSDFTRFSNGSYTKITGYVVEVKQGGVESCNCESIIDSLQDTHIYISLSPNAEKKDCIIVEITPRFKRLNKGTNAFLLKGKLVSIYGYLFFDEEHKQSAVNTCKTCTTVWRKTCWEIHPVCKIELIKE